MKASYTVVTPPFNLGHLCMCFSSHKVEQERSGPPPLPAEQLEGAAGKKVFDSGGGHGPNQRLCVGHNYCSH